MRPRTPSRITDATRPQAEARSGDADREEKRKLRWADESRGGVLATGATSSVPIPSASAVTANQEARGWSPVPPAVRQLRLTPGPGAKGHGKTGANRAARWRANKALQKSKGSGKGGEAAVTGVPAAAPVPAASLRVLGATAKGKGRGQRGKGHRPIAAPASRPGENGRPLQ